MKIAVIGCGVMGSRRIAALRQLGERDITVYDVDPKRAEAVSVKYGVAAIADEAWAWDWKTDCVIICTPPESHLAWLHSAFISAVPAIFVEKPLALALPDHGYSEAITMVGCNLRWHVAAQAISRWLPTIGSVHNARVWAGYHLPSTRPDWQTSYAATTGATLDVGSHMLDLALDWLGPARLTCSTVKSAASIGLPDVDGSAVMLLHHDSGVTSTVSADFTHPTYKQGATICGERGTIGYDWTRRCAYRHDYTTDATERVTWDEDESESMYTRETAAFLDCVRAGAVTPNPIARASQTLAILLQARQHGC